MSSSLPGRLVERARGAWAPCGLHLLTRVRYDVDVRGEQIRRDLTEGQGGVKMTIDIQVVDVKTCKPIPKAAVDFWSCNSTVRETRPVQTGTPGRDANCGP